MQIRKQALRKYPKYLHDIAVDQLVEDYEAKGYQVSKEYPIGNYRADLFAKKNGESIVFEVKVGKLDTKKRERLKVISEYVKEKDYKFKIVIANTPREKKINVPDIKSIFDTYFQKSSLYQLSHLAKKVRYKSVNYIEVNEAIFNDETDIRLNGTGNIEIELTDTQTYPEVFPFEFDLILTNVKSKLAIKDMVHLEFDTSDF